MKEHVKYGQARNQLYGVKVAFRELREKMPKHHRTPQLEQLLDILQTVIDQSSDSFENGNILEVLINVYVPTPLPGFEEYVARARQAAKMGLPLTDDEKKALDDRLNDFLDGYTPDDPFEGKADWDVQGSQPPDSDWEDYKAECDWLFNDAGGNEKPL